jgi:hypothetical protein
MDPLAWHVPVFFLKSRRVECALDACIFYRVAPSELLANELSGFLKGVFYEFHAGFAIEKETHEEGDARFHGLVDTWTVDCEECQTTHELRLGAAPQGDTGAHVYFGICPACGTEAEVWVSPWSQAAATGGS